MKQSKKNEPESDVLRLIQGDLQVSLVYPEYALSRGWHGTVRLLIEFKPGEKTRVLIIESSGFSMLDEAARTAAAQWNYEKYISQKAVFPISVRFIIP